MTLLNEFKEFTDKITYIEIKLFEIKVVKAIDLKIMYKQEENIEPEFMKRNGTNPFRAPEGYFDSLEDRIMGKITVTEKKPKASASGQIIRFLKPLVGVAASIALVYVLVNKPATQRGINTDASSAFSFSMKDDSAITFSMVDENTLVNAIFTEEESPVSDINPDDMLAYLSSGLNEVEIYSEIQN